MPCHHSYTSRYFDGGQVIRNAFVFTVLHLQHLLALLFPCIGLPTLFTVAASAEAPAKDTSSIVCIGYGMAGLADDKLCHSGFIEWRSSLYWYGLSPYTFGSWRKTGASYIGIGLLYSIELTSRVRLCASCGPGYFERDGDFDLGSKLEFASTIEVSYLLPGGRRIALGIGHISNAGVSRRNPGSEYFRIGVQLPVMKQKSSERFVRSSRAPR